MKLTARQSINETMREGKEMLCLYSFWQLFRRWKQVCDRANLSWHRLLDKEAIDDEEDDHGQGAAKAQGHSHVWQRREALSLTKAAPADASAGTGLYSVRHGAVVQARQPDHAELGETTLSPQARPVRHCSEWRLRVPRSH